MRPRALDEVVGQVQLLGPGTWLRGAVERRALSSILLWGPPGVGKTTLGRLLAQEVGAAFVPLSAVMAGVKELREAVAAAQARRDQHSVRTVLFVDEVHRFNKAQQDALLPHVESGLVTLVGATTENPSFEVNAALLSRTKVLVLRPLGPAELRRILDRALEDAERGLGGEPLDCAPEVRDLIAQEARGDARRALAALEAAASVPPPDVHGRRVIDRAAVAEALSSKALLHDKGGEQHYGVISAFIKSLRGSDPDAAVYWLARLLEAGEDVMFVARRLVIFASEDVGNAAPQALTVAIAAMQAAHFVGMPEAIYPLTQAVTYLAVAPKSHSALTAYRAARADVEAHGALSVPLHLRDAATELPRGLGYGQGYRDPHDYDGHVATDTYLPLELAGRRYYEPSTSGHERELAVRLERLRGARSTP
jgi:putative ATPase